MINKTLVLLTDNYPYSPGEFFIDDEMQIIAPKFEKIIIITKDEKKNNSKRFIPQNAKVFVSSDAMSFFDKLKAIPVLLKLIITKESTFIFKRYGLKSFFMILKIIFMDTVKALKLKKLLHQISIEEYLSENKTIFYSYWHDYKALSIALLKNGNPNLKCIARAHRWDVYFKENSFPYLPFKSFILTNLSATYTISSDGQNEFKKLISDSINTKIEVSRLGKINLMPLAIKQNKNYLFCSCSTLIPVKRVHLIIDLLSTINQTNVEWVHFGEGFLKSELESYAKQKLPNVKFSFKGLIDNVTILNYYSKNYVDIFLNVSESEGIPVSIMEAQSAAIPVLATNVGGTPEIVNNVNGFLIEKDFDIQVIAERINVYLVSAAELQLHKRKASYQNWQENYNAEKNYSSFVENILNL